MEFLLYLLAFLRISVTRIAYGVFQMDEKKNVIVIGAGIGGIATAGYLASTGYNVTIFEKNAYPGGRCGRYVKDGHRFDIGATFLMMPGCI